MVEMMNVMMKMYESRIEQMQKTMDQQSLEIKQTMAKMVQVAESSSSPKPKGTLEDELKPIHAKDIKAPGEY